MKKKVAIKSAARLLAMKRDTDDRRASVIKQIMERMDEIKPAAGSRATSRNIEERLISARKGKQKPKPPTCPHLLICSENFFPCGTLLICGGNGGTCGWLIWEPTPD